MAEQKTKEIGIRKILGATFINITQLLAKDFALLILLACIIAFPVAGWLMLEWLKEFAYRITISWWMFLTAAVSAVMIAALTIGFRAVKAAAVNPVKSLRTE
jgi:putative ABC transport system permease protein